MRQINQLIAALTVTLFAMLGILSCNAYSGDSGKSASADASAPSSVAAPDSEPSVIVDEASPTPAATPSVSRPLRLRGGNFLPDRPNYSSPATP
jgi:hypothetical protein